MPPPYLVSQFLKHNMIGNLKITNQSAIMLYAILIIFLFLCDIRFKMATTGESGLFSGTKMSSLEEDFTYGVTVAQTNIKIRLG